MNAASRATRSAALWPSAGDGGPRASACRHDQSHLQNRASVRENAQIDRPIMPQGALQRDLSPTSPGIAQKQSP